MKSLIAVLSVMFAVAACGSDETQSHSSSLAAAEASPEKRVLIPIEGSIESVKTRSASSPAVGTWTEVEVAFPVHCAHQLEAAALGYERDDGGKVKIFSSAFVSAPKTHAGDLLCQAFIMHTEKISLPGVVGFDELVLVALNADGSAVPADTASTTTASNIEVIGTRSLCPAGSICAKNGTVVTLAIELGSCVNTLGPVAYVAEQMFSGDDLAGLKLTVHAIEFQHKNAPIVRCARQIVTKDISLPSLYARKGVDLRVLN